MEDIVHTAPYITMYHLVLDVMNAVHKIYVVYCIFDEKMPNCQGPKKDQDQHYTKEAYAPLTIHLEHQYVAYICNK
jgi:hypothetical protein